MKLKSLVVILLLIIFGNQSFTQNLSGEIQDNPSYIEACEIYNSGNYVAAMHLFEKLYASNTDEDNFSQKANSLYFLAVCYEKTGNVQSAEKYLYEFLDLYPESINNQSAKWELAGICFDKKNYKAALQLYENVNIFKLNAEEKEKFFFNKGYCYLKIDDLDNAASCFFEIKDNKSDIGKAAAYYYAHISFDKQNYESALQTFQKLVDDAEFGTTSTHYIVRILYVQGKYDEIISMADNIKLLKNKKNSAETEKIIADAYFQTGNYDKALPALLKTASSASRYQNYQIAYCYFKNNDFAKAIPYFEKATSTNDELGQNAFYHLGLCNLKTNNKKFAATAFREAHKLNYNEQIKENALFNYVNIVYETGFDPYNEAISALQQFIDDNPASQHLDDAYSFLANLYLSTKNYKNALNYIDKLDVKTPELKIAHQKITYSTALETFEAGKYEDAISMFRTSHKYGLDKTISASAAYWIAESYYKSGNYSAAIEEYKSFLKMPLAYDLDIYNNANYSLGYCYFKQKNYVDAEKFFRKFINSRTHSDKLLLSDAWNRVGDCYFIQHQYSQAVKSYNQTIELKTGKVDYAYYYKAVAYGATGSLDAKISTLQEFLKMSKTTSFRSNALFELANTYTLNENVNQAITTYKQVITDYPNTTFSVKSKQKIGLLYYAQNKYDNALSYLKDVVVSYPGTIEANESLASLKNIYIELNRVDDYMAFVNSSTNIVTSVSEADSMSFASAQNLFAARKYAEAKPILQNYIAVFHSGAFLPTVYFYLAECYFFEEKYDSAQIYYRNVTDSPKTMFTETAEIQSAKIYFYNQDYENSAKLYEKIIQQSDYDYVINEAKIALMRCYDELSEYDKLYSLSKEVINIPEIEAAVYEEAKLNIAHSQFGLGKYDTAYSEFLSFAEKYKTEKGAEAKYFCAFIDYLSDDYQKSEKEIFELVENYNSYDYWVARSFILLADVYVKTDNVFQAKQTLQSIVDNYEGEDLKLEAKSKLKAIEALDENIDN
ncbi:MAG: tetratricopeptide repeat protein [Bacteroidales bacterium]|nr:tetratricopeptide repeat protein [Bacteroidales bacterium]